MAPRKSIFGALGSLFKSKTDEEATAQFNALSISGNKNAKSGDSGVSTDLVGGVTGALVPNIADEALLATLARVSTDTSSLGLERTSMFCISNSTLTSLISRKQKDPKTFSIKGLPLSYFLVLIDQWGGRARFNGLTTTQVCDRFLKPVTKVSLCAQLYLSNDDQVSSKVQNAKWFISHAWKYKFLDVVDSLVHFCEKNEFDQDETIFWFDLFSNSQHGTADKDFEWWETVFMNAVKSIGNVVMVLEPWTDPIPLKRVWCIFEVYACSFTESEFHIAMTLETEAKFLQALKDDTHNFNTVLSNVNSLKSESWNPADKESIFEVVKETVGFTKLDRLVFETISEWVISTLQSQYDACLETGDEISQLQWGHALGGFFSQTAQFAEAGNLLTDVYNGRVELLGKDHPDTLKSMVELISVMHAVKRFDDSEPLVFDCLARCRKVLGNKSLDTLKAMHVVYMFHVLQKRFDLAEPILMECLRTSKRVLGTTHQDTARVMNDIGHMRIFQGRFKEAESMFTGAYITYKLLYGEDSPLTQIQLSSLGVAYSYRGKEQSAEKAFLDSIESLNRTVGSGAPEVAAAYSNLADLYLRQKRFTAAEYYYLEAYETRCKSYTQFDEGSLRALYKVGFAAQCQGDKMDIARKLYEKCIEVSLLFHGPQSNVTLDCEARLKEVNAILGISREYDHVSIMKRQLAAHQQYNSAMESSFDDYLTGLFE